MSLEYCSFITVFPGKIITSSGAKVWHWFDEAFYKEHTDILIEDTNRHKFAFLKEDGPSILTHIKLISLFWSVFGQSRVSVSLTLTKLLVCSLLTNNRNQLFFWTSFHVFWRQHLYFSLEPIYALENHQPLCILAHMTASKIHINCITIFALQNVYQLAKQYRDFWCLFS